MLFTLCMYDLTSPKQHGSVYWNKNGIEQLNNLDSKRTLSEQLQNAFSIPQSPIWQDASTTTECRALENLVGGPEALAKLTGSKAYERFTGNQIAKVCI
jgi:xylulokinase